MMNEEKNAEAMKYTILSGRNRESKEEETKSNMVKQRDDKKVITTDDIIYNQLQDECKLETYIGNNYN